MKWIVIFTHDRIVENKTTGPEMEMHALSPMSPNRNLVTVPAVPEMEASIVPTGNAYSSLVL